MGLPESEFCLYGDCLTIAYVLSAEIELPSFLVGWIAVAMDRFVFEWDLWNIREFGCVGRYVLSPCDELALSSHC